MDMKGIVGGARSGRRGALTGILAGAALLLGRGGGVAAGNGRCRSLRRQLRANRCPQRACCLCGPGPNEGCHYVAANEDIDALTDVCREVCSGGSGGIAAVATTPGESLACNTTGTQCHRVACPLF